MNAANQQKLPRTAGTKIYDVLVFRTMIAPYVLQLLFWAGIGGCIYGAHLLFSRGHWAWWIALVFGSLLTRVIFERALLAFETYNRLVELLQATRQREAG